MLPVGRVLSESQYVQAHLLVLAEARYDGGLKHTPTLKMKYMFMNGCKPPREISDMKVFLPKYFDTVCLC